MTTNIDRAIVAINEVFAGEWVKSHMTPPKVAQALADAGLLTPTPQIIRTVEELEALDPDTLLYIEREFASFQYADVSRSEELPAVVVAPAEQVRAARKALEEA